MNNLATVPIAGLSTATPASPPIAETLQVLLTAAWRRRYLIVTPMLFLPVLGGIAAALRAEDLRNQDDDPDPGAGQAEPVPGGPERQDQPEGPHAGAVVAADQPACDAVGGGRSRDDPPGFEGEADRRRRGRPVRRGIGPVDRPGTGGAALQGRHAGGHRQGADADRRALHGAGGGAGGQLHAELGFVPRQGTGRRQKAAGGRRGGGGGVPQRRTRSRCPTSGPATCSG